MSTEEKWFAVYCDGKPYAAYPRRSQAEIYASGFSRPCEIKELGEALVLHESPPAPPAQCVIGEYCHTHGFSHGAEAEELRERFETLAADENTPSFQRRRVRRILDDVDARDSAAFVSTTEGMKPRPSARGEAPLPATTSIQELWDLEAQHPPLLGNRSRPRKSNQVDAPLPAAPPRESAVDRAFIDEVGAAFDEATGCEHTGQSNLWCYWPNSDPDTACRECRKLFSAILRFRAAAPVASPSPP